MQTSELHIARQQLVLTRLGHYHGPIDGIWGPDSITAKKEFEGSGRFNPGIPNNGLPFASFGPLPLGLYMNQGMLIIQDQEDEIEAEEMSIRESKDPKSKLSDKE